MLSTLSRPKLIKDIGLRLSGRLLRTSSTAVLNAQRKVHGGLDAPFVGVNDLEEDLKNTLEW